jgi:lipoprotein NlpD
MSWSDIKAADPMTVVEFTRVDTRVRTNIGQRFCPTLLRAALCTFTLLLAACSSQSSWNYAANEYHVVRSGETLSSIGNRYGIGHRDLARWNSLGDGSLIYPGQKLQLTPSSTASAASQQNSATAAARKNPAPARAAAPPPGWDWPTNGRVIAGFGGQRGSATGLLIGGKAGQPVRAAAGGRVVYSGGGLIGYGQLIIVKHNDTYLSAYGHNESLLVKEGEQIKKGQRIATMGEGPGLEPRLHFEIRRNGKPVDPRQYLPAR